MSLFFNYLSLLCLAQQQNQISRQLLSELAMIPCKKNHQPLQPKILSITKEQFRKFHVVRKLASPALGNHQLLSWNQKKFISKELPPTSNTFKTTRTLNSQIFHYAPQNIFIFPLPGEPLSNILRMGTFASSELKKWVQKHGDEEEAYISLLKYAITLHLDHNVIDLLMECFRVVDDQLAYCYDTWMKGSVEIVTENILELENYFLCQKQLDAANGASTGQIGFRDFLFKLGLMVLNLGVPQVKMRNYEYSQYSINYTNISEKLKLFKIKYSRKNLGTLIDDFLHYKIETIDDLNKIIETKKRAKTITSVNDLYENEKSIKTITNLNKSLSKSFVDKQNLNASLHHPRHHDHGRKSLNSNIARKKVSIAHNQSLNCSLLENLAPSTSKKIKLKQKNNKNTHNNNNNNKPIKTNQSINDLTTIHNHSHSHISTEQIDLKSLLSKLKEFESCTKLINYLNLSEYMPKSKYQETIVNVFQEIRIKDQWVHRVYPNGSIYWGEMQDDLRTGMGIYMFDSHDFYYGRWYKNCMSGLGTYVFKSGESYKGELMQGIKEGYGQFHYKDGRIFQGNWLNNNKIGLGSVKFPNGVNFTGFFNNSPHTEGIFTKTDEQEIIQCFGILQNYNWETGQFQPQKSEQQIKNRKLKKCKVDTFTLCTDHQGNKYMGQCENGSMPDGFGIKQNENWVHEGQWKSGKEDGKGKLTMKNKFSVSGIWKEGVMVEYWVSQ